MASIEIKDASVSYFLRATGHGQHSLGRDSVGAQIIERRGYLEIAALRNISFSAKDGDRYGLIGINGSGKSTLLKLCSGALAVQSGSIAIDGTVRPQFALSSGIRHNLSGRRNAELKALYLGVPQRAIPQRIEEIKDLSGLGGYFELPVDTYSAGMRSRLVMSLMRLVRGEILVMDEWIAAADASIKQTASTLQAKLIESASIVILASHQEQVLKDWTNKLVWLDNGIMKAHGPVEDVLKEYQTWLKSSGR